MEKGSWKKVSKLKKGGFRKAEITSVELLDELMGKGVEEVKFGEKVLLRIECVANEDIDDLSVGIAIENPEMRVYGTNTEVQQLKIPSLRSRVAKKYYAEWREVNILLMWLPTIVMSQSRGTKHDN